MFSVGAETEKRDGLVLRNPPNSSKEKEIPFFKKIEDFFKNLTSSDSANAQKVSSSSLALDNDWIIFDQYGMSSPLNMNSLQGKLQESQQKITEAFNLFTLQANEINRDLQRLHQQTADKIQNGGTLSESDIKHLKLIAEIGEDFKKKFYQTAKDIQGLQQDLQNQALQANKEVELFALSIQMQQFELYKQKMQLQREQMEYQVKMTLLIRDQVLKEKAQQFEHQRQLKELKKQEEQQRHALEKAQRAQKCYPREGIVPYLLFSFQVSYHPCPPVCVNTYEYEYVEYRSNPGGFCRNENFFITFKN